MRSGGATGAAWVGLSFGIGLAALVGGCEIENSGRPVPPAQINFPIAIVLAGEPSVSGSPFLLVANANFDLRYAAGTLQSYALDAIEARIADRSFRCDPEAGDPCDEPGECRPEAFRPCVISDDELPSLIVSEVLLGSHMDGLALSSVGDRAYLPVRSDRGGLSWVELASGTGMLHCGSVIDQGREECDVAHRSTDETIARSAGQTLPSDPVALAVVPLATLGLGVGGDYVVMAHRNGHASLFLDDHDALTPGRPPRYLHTLAGVPNDIVTIEASPDGLVWLTSAAAVAMRASRDLVALEIALARPPDPASAQLRIARRFTLRGLDDGTDTRDVAFDEGTERLWVLARRPDAVITVDFRVPPPVPGDAPITSVHSVGVGPSRLELYRPRVGEANRTLLVASCYDARALFVVDPDLGTIATVPGIDGPFEMAIDHVRGRAYVADFRFSVIWIVDLSPLVDGGSPVVLGRLGSGHAPSVFR
jgi:DNA-binding beta-propeller fold protein YncE